MENPKFRWCRETVEQIRFKPDRDKVREELMAHIEDRSEVWKQSGLSEEEAEAKAVAAMGDPVEVGKQLDAVHKPWLGWLWRLSRWLLWASWFGALLFTILFWGDVVEYFDGRYRWLKEEPKAEQQLAWTESDWIVDIGASGALGDNTFRVDKAAWRAVSEETGTLRLSCTVEYPWYRPSPSLRVIERVYFLDEDGNRWVNCGENIDPGEYWVWAYSRSDWFARSVGVGIEYVPRDTRWIDLCYDYAGRTMTIRIDLTGGWQS